MSNVINTLKTDDIWSLILVCHLLNLFRASGWNRDNWNWKAILLYKEWTNYCLKLTPLDDSYVLKWAISLSITYQLETLYRLALNFTHYRHYCWQSSGIVNISVKVKRSIYSSHHIYEKFTSKLLIFKCVKLRIN